MRYKGSPQKNRTTNYVCVILHGCVIVDSLNGIMGIQKIWVHKHFFHVIYKLDAAAVVVFCRLM